MRTFVSIIFIAMLALPAFAQPIVRGEFAEPDGAELSTFPTMQKPLTIAEQAELGLSAVRLDKPTVVQNHFRNIRGGRFVLETLPAGTLVLVDEDEVLRYKADCGNRIAEVQPCPECPPVVGTAGVEDEVATSTPGAWSRFWDAAGRGWGLMWESLGGFIGLLLPFLLFLALLGLLGYLLYRAIQNRRRGQNPPPPPAQQTQQAGVVPAVAVGPQAAAPAQQAGNPPPAPPNPVAPAPRARRFRFTLGRDGNIFSRMEGYRNLRVDEDENGNITINADRA